MVVVVVVGVVVVVVFLLTKPIRQHESCSGKTKTKQKKT